jgi:modulator of FtsH protease
MNAFQFKELFMSFNHTYSSPKSAQSVLETNKVLRNTYMLLGMTLLFSAVTAGISMAMQLPYIMGLVFSIAGLVTLFVVNKKADSASGLPWVFVFTGLMGAALGPMLNHYAAMPNGPMLIMQALGSTALVFFGLSAYAMTTKKDFSFLGGFLFVGLIVVVLVSLVNLFVGSSVVFMAMNAAIVFIMSGLILFDTSRIINGGETNYIRATVSLYLNVYNLFTSILHLLGANND